MQLVRIGKNAVGEGEMADNRYWLIWDGECGLCRRAVSWVELRDHNKVIRTSPYQHTPSPPMTADLEQEARDAVLVIGPSGEKMSGGRAVLFVLEALGWTRTARIMSAGPMAAITEWGYRRVANNRALIGRVLFGRSCAADTDPSHD